MPYTTFVLVFLVAAMLIDNGAPVLASVLVVIAVLEVIAPTVRRWWEMAKTWLAGKNKRVQNTFIIVISLAAIPLQWALFALAFWLWHHGNPTLGDLVAAVRR
jgi:hypothetical protein